MTTATAVGVSSLEGIPSDARFRPVKDKNPGHPGLLWCGDQFRKDDGSGWNKEGWKWQTADQIPLTRNEPSNTYTGTGLMTGSKVGGYCWIDFDGEELGEGGEYIKHAMGDFMEVFGKPWTDLPKAPMNISGRPGRFRLLFRVPKEWHRELRGLSLRSTGPTKSIEFLYEMGGGVCFHAVIEGKHPGGNGWHYRWEEGLSPREVEIPDLPIWMLVAIKTWPLRQQQEQASETAAYSDSEPRPMDLLSPGQQRKLVVKMIPYLPYRGAPEGKLAGTYDVVCRVLLSLWRGIGDPKMASIWLQDWDDKSDWDGSQTSSAPVTGGSMEGLATSLMNAKESKDKVQPWATACSIAQENGFKFPSWAMPAREITIDDLSVNTARSIDAVKNGLDLIEQMDTPADRMMASMRLRDSLDMKEKEFNMILQLLQNEKMKQNTDGWFDDVCDNAKPIEEAIERFLPFGVVTMLGADPGVGKSTFIYRLAQAAAYGMKFMGQLQTVRGNVLVVQMDEPDSNMRQKRDRMAGKLDPDRRIRVKREFSAGHLKNLREWIQEYDARYVVMDSFASLFAGGADLVDSQAGQYLYGLNEIASDFNVAILLTHHLKKKPMSGERQSVCLSEFYGSVFIGAGTSDAWGLYRDPEAEGDDKPFILKNVKPRSGIAEMGDKFLVEGNTEDLSLSVMAVNGMTDGVGKLKQTEQRVLSLLKKLTCADRAVAIGQVGKPGTICGETGLTKKQVQRAMTRLQKLPEVQRTTLPSENRGAQPYGYWWRGV